MHTTPCSLHLLPSIQRCQGELPQPRSALPDAMLQHWRTATTRSPRTSPSELVPHFPHPRHHVALSLRHSLVRWDQGDPGAAVERERLEVRVESRAGVLASAISCVGGATGERGEREKDNPETRSSPPFPSSQSQLNGRLLPLRWLRKEGIATLLEMPFCGTDGRLLQHRAPESRELLP